MTDTGTQPVAIGPGEGLSVENPVGGVLTFKATAADTGGALTAIDTVAAPGEGPPLHVHGEDELIYTLEGTFRVRLGDDVVTAPAGSFVFIPGGIPHTWQNVDDTPGRFFAAVMPAATGFEQFFMRYARLPAEDRGVEAFTRLARETQAFAVVGPPLG